MKTTIKLIITIAAMVISFASNAQVLTTSLCEGTFSNYHGTIGAEIVVLQSNSKTAVYKVDLSLFHGGPTHIVYCKIKPECYDILDNLYPLQVGFIIPVDVFLTWTYIKDGNSDDCKLVYKNYTTYPTDCK